MFLLLIKNKNQSKLVFKNIVISFFGSVIKTSINYFSLFYLSRKLGPEISGQLNYLLAIFLALRMVFDPGYSNVFFSVISEENKEKFFYQFYFILIFFQFLLPVSLFFLLPNKWIFQIWNTQDKLLILLTFLIVFLQNTVWDFFSKVLESRRYFLKTQSIQIISNTLGLISLLALNYFGRLTLINAVYVLLTQWIIATLLALYFYIKIDFKIASVEQSFLDWAKKIFNLTKPLIFVSILGFCTDFFDRWLLQNQFGNKDQSFFSFGLTIASIGTFLGTGIFTVLWKEFSEANFTKNIDKIKSIYTRFYFTLFLTTSFFCIYFVPWVPDIILFTVGKQFLEAKSTVIVLLFLPIYQLIGRLNMVFSYATSRNNLILYNNLLSFVLSLIFTYVLIGPKNYFIPGLGLGAVGLAAKTLIVNWIVITIFSFKISKIVNTKFSALNEVYIIFSFLFFSFLSFYLTKFLNLDSSLRLISLLISFIIYTLFMFSTILIMKKVNSKPYVFMVNSFNLIKNVFTK